MEGGHRAFESDSLPERYRGLNLDDLQLLRYVDVYWRGMRRDKKDYSAEREREHGADHLLLVFERYLVFLEKPSGSGSSSLLLTSSESGAAALPALHLRPLPVIDLSAATAPSSANANNKEKELNLKGPVSGESKRLTIQLCPIVELAGVIKVTADARGEYPKFHTHEVMRSSFTLPHTNTEDTHL